MYDFLLILYPWIKSLHVMAVLSWMAGLFYLPRLFVYHVEKATIGDQLDQTFQIMEQKLFRFIMHPAMLVAWGCGVIMVITPGVIDWSAIWPWSKLVGILVMTWFHVWLGRKRVDFETGSNTLTGRQYRLMNEVPTLAMVVIVLSVIVKF